VPAKPTPEPPRPTDAELAILRVLWKRGPGSVREVLVAVNEQRDPPLAYTTVLRFLQIMTEKGLVRREDGERGHVYEPAAPAQKTKKQLVGDLMNRLFDGSVRDLVLQALGSKKVSAAELREIRKLLDQLDS
jgi:BlaI family transcriptional regulator, penicillinase repressor